MLCKVTESYSIDLPPGVRSEDDEKVTSYWFEDGGLILQLSSYKRYEGEIWPAHDRLGNHLKKQGRPNAVHVQLKVTSPDFAAATYTDEEGREWLMSYLVWPDLTIFATIISGELHEPILDSWASRSIESIERIVDS